MLDISSSFSQNWINIGKLLLFYGKNISVLLIYCIGTAAISIGHSFSIGSIELIYHSNIICTVRAFLRQITAPL